MMGKSKGTRILKSAGEATIVPPPRPARLLIASNRLPVTLRGRGREVRAVPSVGGLATALGQVRRATGGRWFGWHGRETPLTAFERRLMADDPAWDGLGAIDLSKEEIRRFYIGYANAVIWPAFHYLVDRLPLLSDDWPSYAAVNRRIAQMIAREWREGDVVQIHDYHLMLVPKLLRELRPGARIGFFLHIPFPSSEIFRILPRRAEILDGLLGADLVGFHTLGYARHFGAAVLRVLGTGATLDRIRWQGRDVRFGAYPLGIDAADFAALARSPQIMEDARSVRSEDRAVKLILGVDRLDYTKGIPRRLLAFEWLLDHEPGLRGKIRLLQVAAPSRDDVAEYAAFKRGVDELVGRINGRFGTARYTPVRYVNRSLSRQEVVALYLAADVMCVTPLRDGMNLVAKEFVAAREGSDAVLILSEFAGAASELGEALMVNPYDVEAMGETFSTALAMPSAERRSRLSAMAARVRRNDVATWNERFMADLAGCVSRPEPRPLAGEILGRVKRAPSLVMLLDYDGTLVPFVSDPSAAGPDRELISLLDRVAARRGTRVHVVSGRSCEDLGRWFHGTAVWLHAEHGLWSKPPNGTWHRRRVAAPTWKPAVREMLDGIARHVPGSFIEEKSAGLVWHYREAEAPAAEMAKELRLHLVELFGSAPTEVIAGDKVLEVRTAGINKGLVAAAVLGGKRVRPLIVAIGDDRTDEDLFVALPTGSVTIGVGPSLTGTSWRLRNWRAVRAFLRTLVRGSPNRRKARGR